MSLNAFFVVLPLLLLWILLLIGLFRTHRCLDQAGYAICPAPVRVSNGRAAAAWLGFTALAVVVSLSLSLHLPLPGQIPLTSSSQPSPLRTQLEELGFPAELLAQLPDRQVAKLEGATHIQVDSGSNPDADNLSMDVVSVMFTQTGDVKMFAFFQWETPPEPSMLEGIHLVPIVQNSAPSVSVSGPYGMLQWEKDGRSFQTSLSTLFTFPPEIQLTTHAPWPMSADITFSLPKEGEHIRGYITWGLHGFFTMTYFNARVTYLHQQSPLLYPWDTPCNVYRNQSPMDYSPFDTHDLLVEVAYPGPTS